MIAINNSEFDELILKFYSFKEQLNNNLNNISSLVSELESCYDCPAGRELISKFHNLESANFKLVMDNFDSYIADLKIARTNVEAFDKNLSARIVEINEIFVNEMGGN